MSTHPYWSPTRRFLALSCALLIFILAPASGTPVPRPIKFARGAFSAQVRGRFSTAGQAVLYSLKAKAGQRMVVNIIPQTPGLATAGTVTFPSGKQDGQPGGVIFDGPLPESGTYTIRVTQHQMASNLPRGTFLLEVIIR